MLDFNRLPQHVAIIMDGNGRWAKKRGLNRVFGHQEGTKRAKEIIEAAREIGIKVLTLYTFSLENWQRPKEEVEFLMKLLEDYLQTETPNMLKQDICFRVAGEVSLLPLSTQKKISETIAATSHCKAMVLNLALSYGGRQEIITAVKAIVKDVLDGTLLPEKIDQKIFGNYLWTRGLPDPDFIIRTSGEMRLSNFLLWQAAYAEFYVTPTLWPDFSKTKFIQALEDYQRRERRFGKLSEQLKHE